MTLLYDPVDPYTHPMSRVVSWTDADFVADDILCIVESMRRCGSHMMVETAADASVTVRVNSYIVRRPIHPDAERLGFWAPDLSGDNETTYLEPNVYTVTVENGETLEVDLPDIRYVEINALTAGSGVTITVR